MTRGGGLGRLLLIATCASVVIGPAHADGPPTVLVQTETPRRGTIPALVATYGSAMPASDGGMVLSLPQDGRVTRIAATVGERVTEGVALLQFAASAAASSAYAQAVDALAFARTQRQHTAQMLQQRLATRDQLAQADKAVADAASALDALRREGSGRPTQILRAPFDGIVSAIQVAQGDRTQPGAPLVTLVRLDGLVVTVGIDLASLGAVHTGDAARLSPLQGGAALPGHVVRVDSVLNPRTRMVDVDVGVPVGSVVSGEAFAADIVTGKLAGWLVPRDAVLSDGQGAYVFQVDAGKAVRVPVERLGVDGDVAAVSGRIDPTRQLVTQGNYQLSPGMAVREATR